LQAREIGDVCTPPGKTVKPIIMAEDQLALDVNAVSRLAGKFKLRSGQISEEYFDKCRAVEGADVHGRKVVIIEDVITTGGAIFDAAALVGQAGGIVIAVVCAIWRGEAAPRIEGLPGLPVFAALTRDELTINSN
jgi:orotate phosphoribosyltransferase